MRKARFKVIVQPYNIRLSDKRTYPIAIITEITLSALVSLELGVFYRRWVLEELFRASQQSPVFSEVLAKMEKGVLYSLPKQYSSKGFVSLKLAHYFSSCHSSIFTPTNPQVVDREARDCFSSIW